MTIVAPPAHGLVQVDAQSGAVTYTPEADYFGADRFVYAVSDTQGATARAVVRDQRATGERSAAWPTMIWRRRTRMCRWWSMSWPMTRMRMETWIRPA